MLSTAITTKERQTYHKPIHAFADTPPINSRASHNTPIPIFQLAQLQRLTNLSGALCTGLVLFVGENQQRGVAQLLLIQHCRQLIRSGVQALDVGGIDYEDDCGRVGVVAAPVGPDARLASEVPHVEVEVLVGDGFNVETDGRDGGYDFADLEGGNVLDLWSPSRARAVNCCCLSCWKEPTFNLYRRVVFPALSSPRIRIRISFFAHMSFEKVDSMPPILSGRGSK